MFYISKSKANCMQVGLKPPLVSIYNRTGSFFHFIKAQFTVGDISYFKALNGKLLHPIHIFYCNKF